MITNVYINIAAHKEVNSPEAAVYNYVVSNHSSFADCVTHNLESFVVSVMIECVTNP